MYMNEQTLVFVFQAQKNTMCDYFTAVLMLLFQILIKLINYRLNGDKQSESMHDMKLGRFQLKNYRHFLYVNACVYDIVTIFKIFINARSFRGPTKFQALFFHRHSLVCSLAISIFK